MSTGIYRKVKPNVLPSFHGENVLHCDSLNEYSYTNECTSVLDQLTAHKRRSFKASNLRIKDEGIELLVPAHRHGRLFVKFGAMAEADAS